jgi:hypothetical protein
VWSFNKSFEVGEKAPALVEPSAGPICLSEVDDFFVHGEDKTPINTVITANIRPGMVYSNESINECLVCP